MECHRKGTHVLDWLNLERNETSFCPHFLFDLFHGRGGPDRHRRRLLYGYQNKRFTGQVRPGCHDLVSKVDGRGERLVPLRLSCQDRPGPGPLDVALDVEPTKTSGPSGPSCPVFMPLCKRHEVTKSLYSICFKVSKVGFPPRVQ